MGALLTFVFSVLAARIFGPFNFGNLALVTTVSAILSISMGIGQTAALKYGSESPDNSVRSHIIPTCTLQMALLTVGSIAIYVLFSAKLSTVFGISTEVYLFAVAYAAIGTFFGFTVNSLRMLFRMRAITLPNALQSVIVLAFFLIFVSTNMKSWQAAVFSLHIGNAVIAVILIVHLRQYITLQFDRPWAKRMTIYS